MMSFCSCFGKNRLSRQRALKVSLVWPILESLTSFIIIIIIAILQQNCSLFVDHDNPMVGRFDGSAICFVVFFFFIFFLVLVFVFFCISCKLRL